MLPLGSVQYKRACYVRRPLVFRLPEPGRRRRPRPCLHDPEQGPGFRSWFVNFIQAELTRYGWNERVPGVSARWECAPRLWLVP